MSSLVVPRPNKFKLEADYVPTGDGGIAVIAGVFLLVGLVCAGGVMLYQRRA